MVLLFVTLTKAKAGPSSLQGAADNLLEDHYSALCLFLKEEERSVWLQGKVFSIVLLLITARRGQWNPRVPLGRHLLQAQLTHKEPSGFLNNRVELTTYILWYKCWSECLRETQTKNGTHYASAWGLVWTDPKGLLSLTMFKAIWPTSGCRSSIRSN